MATWVKLTTKGFEEYLENLARAGKNIDAVTDKALNAGGEVLLKGMKRRVPKDTHNLENNLKIEGPKKDGNYHFVIVGLVHADANTARYGTAQEYGWLSKKGHNPGQPYIRPTLDEDKRKAGKAMLEVFKEAGVE
jgi:HK97 gp10 family phage protein